MSEKDYMRDSMRLDDKQIDFIETMYEKTGRSIDSVLKNHKDLTNNYGGFIMPSDELTQR